MEVIQADAIDLLDGLESGSVPVIITDPPYGVAYHSNYYKDKNPHAPVQNDWNFQIGPFLQACERALCEGGALYLFSRWDVAPLWLPEIAASGLKIKTKIVWVKNNWSAGDLKGCFGNQYEEILFIVKGRHLLRGKRWPNVWNFDRVPSTRLLVPTQKPVMLLGRAIQSSSDREDLIVDPFAGSGSTGAAAKMTGRRYLLGDIDPRMVGIARARLGLPPLAGCDKPEKPATVEYCPTSPDPAEWGIHPEEVRALCDMMTANVREITGQ